MKTRLFDETYTPDVIKDALEGENCGTENMEFVRAFTDDELKNAEREHIELSKELSTLEHKLVEVSRPIKEEMKPIKQGKEVLIGQLKQGGTKVTEKVYCFPDPENRMIGLYDSAGTLVGTRPMNQSERQFHINSFNKRAI